MCHPMPDDTIPEGYTGHIHGCGHPVRPLIMCNDPFCFIESGYFDWLEEHDKAPEGKCICFFCWEKNQNGKSITD